jgi:hypothetical protein
MLHRIVWISEACRRYKEDELISLLNESRSYNVKNNVTGILLYDQKSFMQIMEGAEEVIDEIYYKRIVPSTHHRNVTLLYMGEIEERNFQSWSMGFFYAHDEALHKVPGYLDFQDTHASFLDLKNDDAMVRKLVEGFHRGRWHLGQSGVGPAPKSEEA